MMSIVQRFYSNCWSWIRTFKVQAERFSIIILFSVIWVFGVCPNLGFWSFVLGGESVPGSTHGPLIVVNFCHRGKNVPGCTPGPLGFVQFCHMGKSVPGSTIGPLNFVNFYPRKKVFLAAPLVLFFCKVLTQQKVFQDAPLVPLGLWSFVLGWKVFQAATLFLLFLWAFVSGKKVFPCCTSGPLIFVEFCPNKKVFTGGIQL